MMYTSEVTSQITANKSACMKNKVSKKKHLKIHIVSSFTAPGTTNSLPLKKKKVPKKPLLQYLVQGKLSFNTQHDDELPCNSHFIPFCTFSQTPRTHKVLLESAAL